MSRVKQVQSTTITVDLSTTAGMIAKALSRVPEDAKLSIVTHAGDRPWESSWSEIELSWTEEIEV